MAMCVYINIYIVYTYMYNIYFEKTLREYSLEMSGSLVLSYSCPQDSESPNGLALHTRIYTYNFISHNRGIVKVTTHVYICRWIYIAEHYYVEGTIIYWGSYSIYVLLHQVLIYTLHPENSSHIVCSASILSMLLDF